jgi:hypothetical protein
MARSYGIYLGFIPSGIGGVASFLRSGGDAAVIGAHSAPYGLRHASYRGMPFLPFYNAGLSLQVA